MWGNFTRRSVSRLLSGPLREAFSPRLAPLLDFHRGIYSIGEHLTDLVVNLSLLMYLTLLDMTYLCCPCSGFYIVAQEGYAVYLFIFVTNYFFVRLYIHTRHWHKITWRLDPINYLELFYSD
jgi:hypothetical protein